MALRTPAETQAGAGEQCAGISTGGSAWEQAPVWAGHQPACARPCAARRPGVPPLQQQPREEQEADLATTGRVSRRSTGAPSWGPEGPVHSQAEGSAVGCAPPVGQRSRAWPPPPASRYPQGCHNVAIPQSRHLLSSAPPGHVLSPRASRGPWLALPPSLCPRKASRVLVKPGVWPLLRTRVPQSQAHIQFCRQSSSSRQGREGKGSSAGSCRAEAAARRAALLTKR